jgi:hypothetical protein
VRVKPSGLVSVPTPLVFAAHTLRLPLTRLTDASGRLLASLSSSQPARSLFATAAPVPNPATVASERRATGEQWSLLPWCPSSPGRAMMGTVSRRRSAGTAQVRWRTQPRSTARRATVRCSLPSGGSAQAVMIARDNDTRAALNHAARELWRALGLLGETCSYGSVEIAVGDRVICRRNDRFIDVDNGMRGTVRHVDGDRVVIDTDSGLVRALPSAYVRAPRARLLAYRPRGARAFRARSHVAIGHPAISYSNAEQPSLK